MACSSAPPKANQHTVVDQWRPQVRFYHGRRAFGVDAVRVYHDRRAFGVDEVLSTSVWCRRGACLSWSKSVWCRRGAFIGSVRRLAREASQHAVVDYSRPVWKCLACACRRLGANLWSAGATTFSRQSVVFANQIEDAASEAQDSVFFYLKVFLYLDLSRPCAALRDSAADSGCFAVAAAL